MLAEAKANPDVTVILVHDMSRFSRDSGRAKSLLRELREAGIAVISLNDPEVDPETPSGVYMEAITLAKNEAFSREIAFHTRKGCRANVQKRDLETGWYYKNGGQPLWGYRTQRLERGKDKTERPMLKSIWVLEDTAIGGRPVHEWTRHCLVELAGKGASLDELRDFCNEKGIPAQRNPHWSSSTWHSLLAAPALLKYCGFEVWNVHRKNGTARPASEWVIVENAHAAIITEDEARAIVAARRQRSHKRRFDRGYSRSRKSRYLLSGGLFKCQRCGANMTGFKTGSGPYYVCGSSPYRRGMGCGPGVYVPQDWVEGEMLEGLGSLMQVCSDEDGFVRKVNEELSKLWQESSGYDPQAKGKLKQVDTKIANIRRAIEDGVRDATWANQRLGELQSERQELAQKTVACGEPPQIDAKTAMAYRRKTKKLLKRGTPQERKQLVRTWVQEVKLAPDDLEVEITYRVPEPVMHCLVAGARYTAEKKTPSRIIDFDFERRRVRVSAGTPSELPVTRLAA